MHEIVYFFCILLNWLLHTSSKRADGIIIVEIRWTTCVSHLLLIHLRIVTTGHVILATSTIIGELAIKLLLGIVSRRSTHTSSAAHGTATATKSILLLARATHRASHWRLTRSHSRRNSSHLHSAHSRTSTLWKSGI